MQAKQIKIKEDSLLNYTKEMIRYAVYNHPAEVSDLLRSNGVDVPAGIDLHMLHLMTLAAIAHSDSFSNDLAGLLHAIAMDGQAQESGSGSFSNQTGDGSTSTDASCDPSWFEQTFNPKTVDTIITSGLTLLTSNLQKNGDAGIKQAATPPMPPAKQPAKKSNTGIWVSIIAVAAIGGFGFWYWKQKKQKGS